jgi:hypothetical protein
MIDFESARAVVARYLGEVQDGMNGCGSTLTHYASAVPGFGHHLRSSVVILDEQTEEHEFGWVFFYDCPECVVDGDCSHALSGNAPLIVDRYNGRLYITGTAEPVDFYLEEYREGFRTPAKQRPTRDT